MTPGDAGAGSVYQPVPVTIDAVTGELANEWCPVTQRAWFKPGTEPTEPCRGHEAPYWDDDWGTRLGERIEDAFKRIFRF